MSDNRIAFDPAEVAAYYAARAPNIRHTEARQWRGPCPIHNGKDFNFAVERETGRWFCHSTCGRGGDLIALEQALAGSDFKAAKTAVFRLIGRFGDLIEDRATHASARLGASSRSRTTIPTSAGRTWHEIEAYQYTDRAGLLVFEVVRHERGKGPNREKEFRQRRPDGRHGWTRNLKGIQRVPYRLSNVLNAETIYLPEGEKDVHTLEEWGLVASCNPGGAGGGHLYLEWHEYFRGRHIVILVDNDKPAESTPPRLPRRCWVSGLPSV